MSVGCNVSVLYIISVSVLRILFAPLVQGLGNCATLERSDAGVTGSDKMDLTFLVTSKVADLKLFLFNQL